MAPPHAPLAQRATSREGFRGTSVLVRAVRTSRSLQEVLVRKLFALVAATGALAAFGSAGALAAGNPKPGNPNGTGPPSQSCQSQPSSPRKASSSPGAPFNEPSGSKSGGAGGPNSSPESEYDRG